MKNKGKKQFYFTNKKVDLAEVIANTYLYNQDTSYKMNKNISKNEDVNNVKKYIKRIKH